MAISLFQIFGFGGGIFFKIFEKLIFDYKIFVFQNIQKTGIYVIDTPYVNRHTNFHAKILKFDAQIGRKCFSKF